MRYENIMYKVEGGKPGISDIIANSPRTNRRHLPTPMLGFAALVVLGLLALFASACGGGGGGVVRPVTGQFGPAEEGQPYELILVVAEGGIDGVDGYFLDCRDLYSTFLVGKGSEVSNSRFTIETNDLRIEGKFTSPTSAEAVVTAKSDAAEDCGVGLRDGWQGSCGVGSGLYKFSIEGEEIEVDPDGGPCE